MTTAVGTTELLGVCAAAAALGCHASTISRYLKDFPDLNQGSRTRPKVNVDALRRHRAENFNAARSGSYAGLLLGERNGLDAADGRARPTPNQADAPSYPAARAAREVVLADKAQLDLDEKLGTLVVRAEIEEALEEGARLLQRELLNLASRLAKEIATMGNLQEIQALIETECRALLKSHAAALDVLAEIAALQGRIAAMVEPGRA